MQKILQTALFLMALLPLFTSCSKDGDDSATPGKKDTAYNYVLLTNESASIAGAGYMTAYHSLPSGDLTNIGKTTLQVTSAFGFSQFGKWIFTRMNAAGQAGIQKYTVGNDGKISLGGFIADAQMFHIVDEKTGYYQDPTRGTMLLQIFNPTTMERTGQIDLSSLRLDGADYNSVGEHIIASRDGKLYVGVVHAEDNGPYSGYGDGTLVDYVELAVIDIAANKLDKTIKYNGVKSLGWGAAANKMWTLGDDGALYFYGTGMSMIPPMSVNNSAIIRIKKGETDFDTGWILKADDLQAHATIGGAVVKKGKLYIQLPSEPIADGFTNLDNPIWDYYAVDINTLKATKITGMPQTQYAHGNEQCIVEVDGKIYLWMANAKAHENGYYLLDEGTNKASQAFNVTDGGLVSGFFKLAN